jgi:hypothetical protein
MYTDMLIIYKNCGIHPVHDRSNVMFNVEPNYPNYVYAVKSVHNWRGTLNMFHVLNTKLGTS